MKNLFYIGQKRAATLPKVSTWITDPYESYTDANGKKCYKWLDCCKGVVDGAMFRLVPNRYLSISVTKANLMLVLDNSQDKASATLDEDCVVKHCYFYNEQLDFLIGIRRSDVGEGINDILDQTSKLLLSGVVFKEISFTFKDYMELKP